MYFSLIPTPGYNLSYLEACGVEGEWELFQGDILETEDTDRIGWNWGGTNCSIAGISWTLWQCSPLSLVELQRDSALIGRELQSVACASNMMPLRTKAPLRGRSNTLKLSNNESRASLELDQ